MDSPGSLPTASPDGPRRDDEERDEDRLDGSLPAEPRPVRDGQLPAAAGGPDPVRPSADSSPRTPLGPASPAGETSGGSTSTTRRERIRQATASGGLDALPDTFVDDGWQVAMSEDLFEVLYLDVEQHDRITAEMVRRHAGLIRAFWDGRIALLSGPGARQVARKYGGAHASADVVRAHAAATDRASQRLSAEGGIEAAAAAHDDRRVALGRERLQPFLEGALLDGELSTAVSASLLEKGRLAGLREDETAAAILDALHSAGFTPFGDPAGTTDADRVRSVTWVTDDRRARLSEERSAVRRALVVPLELAHGTVQTLPELIDYVDTWRDESERLLYRGTLGRWIGANLGKPRLEDEAEAVCTAYFDRPGVGLELFARVLAREVGLDARPRLSVTPPVLDLGEVAVGARLDRTLRIERDGERRGWGTVTVEGDAPGLRVPDTFGIRETEVEVEVTTLHVPPGDYESVVVVSADGGDPVRVPVSYTVAPLDVAVQPGAIDWGTLPYNYEKRVHVTLRSQTPGGRLVGTARIAPEHPGLALSGAIDGERNAFQLTLNTSAFRAGELYVGSIHAETNSGVYSVPVRFSIELAWRRVALWTAGFAALFALAFGAGRWVLADAVDGYRDWSPLPPVEPEAAGLASLLFIAFAALVGLVRWSYRRTTKPSRGPDPESDGASGGGADSWVEDQSSSE